MALRSWSSKGGLCMVGLWVLSLMHGASAQNNTCNAATFTPLLPCLPYLQSGNTSVPSSDCCKPLASLLASVNPTCICQLGPIAEQTGNSINETRALEVAALCNQTVPESIKSCLSSQTTAPLGAPSTTPTSPSSSTPPTQTGKDNGSALSSPSLLLIGSIFVALLLHLGAIST